QIEALLGRDWIGAPHSRDPLILCGDFNAVPRSRVYARMSAHLRDAQTVPPQGRPAPTFPSRLPLLRLDHIFVSRSVDVTRATTVRTAEARLASDHLPVVVDFVVTPATKRHAAHAALAGAHA
ncbi:MAG TPA: endonuclease/exonuclease/phosphatase family protein, partial [Beijerinckiaceae bacterium]